MSMVRIIYWHNICLLICTFIEQSELIAWRGEVSCHEAKQAFFSDCDDDLKLHHKCAFKCFLVLIGIKRVHIKLGDRRGKRK